MPLPPVCPLLAFLRSPSGSGRPDPLLLLRVQRQLRLPSARLGPLARGLVRRRTRRDIILLGCVASAWRTSLRHSILRLRAYQSSFSQGHESCMSLQILSLVDSCVPANAKAPRDMSMRVVFGPGGMLIQTMARDTIGNVRLAGFSTGWSV